MEGSVRLPSLSLHHVFAGERLQAFSDAVFAIIATIMVSVPPLVSLKVSLI